MPCVPYACRLLVSACSVNMCHDSERGLALNFATLRFGEPGEAWGARAPACPGAGGCPRRREGRVWRRGSGRAGAGRAGDSWAPCAVPGLFAALAGLSCARGSPPPPSPGGRWLGNPSRARSAWASSGAPLGDSLRLGTPRCLVVSMALEFDRRSPGTLTLEKGKRKTPFGASVWLPNLNWAPRKSEVAAFRFQSAGKCRPNPGGNQHAGCPFDFS